MLRIVLNRLALHVIGHLYPAYASYKAVKAKNRDPEQHKKWLSYWIINTLFTLFELFGDTLISWLPLYYEAKVAFLVWLMLPQTRGAERLYDMLVKPHLKKYEATIDENCDRLLRQTTATAGSYFKAASDVVRARVIDAVTPKAGGATPSGQDEEQKTD